MEKTMIDKKLGIIVISVIFSIVIITINLNNYAHAECKNCVMIYDKKFSQNIEYIQNHETIKYTIQNNIYTLNWSLSNSNISSSNNTKIIDLCTGSAQCFSGIVTKVIDGDTLDVGDQRIRLSLINTPERDQNGYFESKSLVDSICGVGTKAIVDQDDGQIAGSYDRLVGVVYCGDNKISLNEILLESKNAKILKKICHKSEFSNTMWAQKFGC